jgi:hypothetical protein
MKTRSAFFSVSLTLVMLASLMFQVTPASAISYNYALGGLGQTYVYNTNAVAKNIAIGLTATSIPVGGTIDGAIVIIGANFQSGDTLSATDSGGVTSSYNSTSGVLTLSGTADISVYQTVLGTVKFSTSSTVENARTVTYSLGTALPYGNGHFFEYVPASFNWSTASATASTRTYFGRTGYLATLNDAGENTFAATKIGGAGAWVGGSDAATEGTWQWVTGPEAGTTFCIGNLNCMVEAGWYANWNTGEPNDGGDGNAGAKENYLQFLGGGTGKWNDLSGISSPDVAGYVVEYGGMGGDTPMTIQGSVTVNVIVNTPPVANPDSYKVNVGNTLTAASVLANDTDADGDVLTAVLVTGPSHATPAFALYSDGTFSYTPAAPYSGPDSFTYKANDGMADSNVTTVTIAVVPTLTILANVPATVKPGDEYIYTFNYTVNATTLNTQIYFPLASHTTFVSSSLPLGAVSADNPSSGCSATAGVVYCDLGTVTANGSFTVTVLVDKLKQVGTNISTAYSIIATSAYPNGAATAMTQVITPFADVNLGYWAFDYIQSVWAHGITTGCIGTPLTYCPQSNITRAEMAIFIERAIGHSDPGTPALTFTDTSASFAKYWIEALKVDGITNGCGGTNYCPQANITRGEMAVFLLRGKSYPTPLLVLPDPATGTYWLDVPATYWAAAWTEKLGKDGISLGCGGGYFCPGNYVTRSEMAVFMQRTFSLTMPTP